MPSHAAKYAVGSCMSMVRPSTVVNLDGDVILWWVTIALEDRAEKDSRRIKGWNSDKNRTCIVDNRFPYE